MARAFPATVLLKTLHPQHHHRTQSSHLLAPTSPVHSWQKMHTKVSLKK